MKIAVVFDQAHARPWADSGAWAAALGDGLARRGHAVVLLGDTSTSATWEAPASVRVRFRAPNRRASQLAPTKFRKWARGALAEEGVERVVSLTWQVAGDVWIPIDRDASIVVRRLLRNPNPVVLGFQLMTRRWLPGMAYGHWRALRVAASKESVLGVIGGRRDLPASYRGVRVERLPIATIGGSPADTAPIDLGERYLVASSIDLNTEGLRAAMRSAQAIGVRLAIVDGEPHRAARVAEGVGAADAVIPLGSVAEVDTVIRGAAAVVSGEEAGSAEAAPRQLVGERRLAARAMALGVPVLAAAGGPATGLFEDAAAGLVVEAATTEAWRAAIERVVLDGERMREAARRVGAGMSMEGLVGEVERLVGGREE